MDKTSPVGRLKTVLIAQLIKMIEDGDCHPSVLAVAAKVVKDFHQEAATVDQSIKDLEEITRNYQLRKAEGKTASH